MTIRLEGIDGECEAAAALTAPVLAFPAGREFHAATMQQGEVLAEQQPEADPDHPLYRYASAQPDAGHNRPGCEADRGEAARSGVEAPECEAG